jgi:hypothetical protein
MDTYLLNDFPVCRPCRHIDATCELTLPTPLSLMLRHIDLGFTRHRSPLDVQLIDAIMK